MRGNRRYPMADGQFVLAPFDKTNRNVLWEYKLPKVVTLRLMHVVLGSERSAQFTLSAH